ncbi:MAG: PAS domain S-box protein [Anaerolineaceae bacterium]|nr:PAS domain S-box protein [Anaerolineaceae bacterium]
MKLRYRLTLILFVLGLGTLLAISSAFTIQSRQVSRKIELGHVENLAKDLARNTSSLIEDKTILARTLSSVPLIQEALLESNLEFDVLSENSRNKRIEDLNNQWMAASDNNDPFIQTYLANPVAEYLLSQEIANPNVFGEIFLTNRYGAVVAATNKLTTFSHAHKYWWQASFYNGKGRIFLDDRGYDTSVNGYVLGVVVPVRYKNEIIGILKCNFNILGSLTDFLQASSANTHGKVQLVRSAGLIVIGEGVEPLSTKISDRVVGLFEVKTNGVETIEENNIRSVVAYAPVPISTGTDEIGFGGSHESIDHIQGNIGENWYIVISADYEEIFVSEYETMRLIVLFGLLYTVLISVIALVLGKMITRPIEAISSAAEEIGAGNLSARVHSTSKTEIGILAKTLNHMADNLLEEKNQREEVQIELQKTLEQLEVRVQERTHELAGVNEQLSEEIVERKQIELRIQKINEELELILNLNPDILCRMSGEGKFLTVNPAFSEILGMSEEELVTVSCWELIHPDDVDKTRTEWVIKFEESPLIEFVNRYRHQDGSYRMLEWRVIKSDDNTLFAAARDITDRKRAEEMAMVSQKLAGIGTLAAGMAHEINNPLQVVTGLSERLIRKIKKGNIENDRFLNDIQKIEQNGWRISHIVRSLLTYSRQVDTQKDYYSLNEIVKEALQLAEHQLQKWSDIHIKKKLKMDIPKLFCDRNNMTQVLINLLTNAADAMPSGGWITIETGFDDINQQLILKVIDSGIGIPEDIRTRIFDPFYTTKDIGEGTGLGLTIIKNIVDAHFGEIIIDSDPGFGTEVSILLPEHPQIENGGRYSDY